MVTGNWEEECCQPIIARWEEECAATNIVTDNEVRGRPAEPGRGAIPVLDVCLNSMTNEYLQCNNFMSGLHMAHTSPSICLD
ncbi:hypothetical protein B5K11_10030 [Rhizobium leguminosarum bv. trifolii]|nr:hypothetical protein B5K11_10030 [Rhizobium leguminosarum bv. trifolii]